MNERPTVVFSRRRLAGRLAELGRKISRHYAGRTVQVVAILDNGAVFAADLVRGIRGRVLCSFVRLEARDVQADGHERREVFFNPEPDLRGRDVLVVDGVLQSGVTMDFLLKRLQQSQPCSLRLAVLVDKPQGRKVDLKPDYFCFRSASKYLVGYGLADEQGLYRNLPYLGCMERAHRRAAGSRRRKGQDR